MIICPLEIFGFLIRLNNELVEKVQPIHWKLSLSLRLKTDFELNYSLFPSFLFLKSFDDHFAAHFW